MKSIFMTALVLLSANIATAQLSFSPQVSTLKIFQGGETSFGAGIKFDYAVGDKTVPYGGFNYFLAKKYESTTIVTANQSNTSPSFLEVDYQTSQNFMHGYIGAKRYLVGEYDNRDFFGLYGLAELGIMLAPTKAGVTENYDNVLYEDIEDIKATYRSFTIGFGLGLEFNLEFAYLFSDVKLNLPATNSSNGTALVNEIPASLNFNIGLRFPLD